MKEDKYIQWLIDNKDIINLSAVEKKIGLAQSTLKHAFNPNNERSLPEHHKKSVIAFVKKTIRV